MANGNAAICANFSVSRRKTARMGRRAAPESFTIA